MPAHRPIAWLTLCAFTLLAPPAPAQPPRDVDSAIDRIKAYLYSQQQPDGSWSIPALAQSDQRGGETALVTYALLLAGESINHPDLRRAIHALQAMRPEGVYALSLRCHVWARLPEAYLPRLREDAEHLRRLADPMGRFSYTRATDRFDHSCTQYGVLGLWEASKRGIPTPRRTWVSLMDHFIQTQNGDGGWGYQPPFDHRQSTGSMTAAGLTVLLVGRREVDPQRDAPDPRIASAIDRGLRWLDERFVPHANPPHGLWLTYYLYGVERVGLAGGYERFNGQDWYATGARALLDQLNDDGSLDSDYHQLIDAAFALAFLARGRDPVWIARLQIPDHDHDQRPDDLDRLCRYLSDFGEQTMHWRRVDIDALEAAFPAPVLWLTGSQTIAWSPHQVHALRRYLDRGGLLVVNPDRGAGPLVESVRQLATLTDPGRAWVTLPPEHPIYAGVVPAPVTQPLQAITTGPRLRILLLPRDWSYAFQSDPTPGDSVAWSLAVNLWAEVTGRGALPPRQATAPPMAELPPVQRTATLVRGLLHDQPPVEPAAYEPWTNHLRQRGVELVTLDLPLEAMAELPPREYPLWHLTGVEPMDLTDEQAQRIVDFARRGGTVLIETLGGQGRFAASMVEQLRPPFGHDPMLIGPDTPLMTGRFDPMAVDLRRVDWRRYTNVTHGPRAQPQLLAWFVDDRPAVIVSHEDLTLGLMHLPLWTLHGYTPDSATAIMTNLLLWAGRP